MNNMNKVLKIQGQTMYPTVSSEGLKIVVQNGDGKFIFEDTITNVNKFLKIQEQKIYSAVSSEGNKIAIHKRKG